MPVLSLGCGSGLIGKNVSGAVTTWIEAGGAGIDAAHIYSWSVGNGDIKEGIAAAAVSRERLFITSKTPCTNKAAEVVNGDLKALGISQLDLLLIHSPHDGGIFASTCGTWKQYNELMAAGTTRAIGVSNFGVSDFEKLRDCGNTFPVLNQVSFSIGMWDSYKDLLSYMSAHNITLEAYSPLQKGAVLKHQEVIDIAAAHNVSGAQVALKWVLQHGATLATSVDGSTTPEYLHQDLDLWSFELSTHEMSVLDAINKPDLGLEVTRNEEMKARGQG